MEPAPTAAANGDVSGRVSTLNKSKNSVAVSRQRAGHVWSWERPAPWLVPPKHSALRCLAARRLPATDADRLRIAEATGKTAAAMAASGGPRPSDIMTEAAFRNALLVLQAIGGSTNGLVHLTAIAGRLGIKIDLEAFDQLGREVPVLIHLKPSGEHYMEHFHQAGGMPRLLAELRGFLTWRALTVTGEPLKASIERAEYVRGQTVIRPLSPPLRRRAAWRFCAAILRRAGRLSSTLPRSEFASA